MFGTIQRVQSLQNLATASVSQLFIGLIPTWLLKECFEESSPFLTDHFNEVNGVPWVFISHKKGSNYSADKKSTRNVMTMLVTHSNCHGKLINLLTISVNMHLDHISNTNSNLWIVKIRSIWWGIKLGSNQGSDETNWRWWRTLLRTFLLWRKPTTTSFQTICTHHYNINISLF